VKFLFNMSRRTFSISDRSVITGWFLSVYRKQNGFCMFQLAVLIRLPCSRHDIVSSYPIPRVSLWISRCPNSISCDVQLFSGLSRPNLSCQEWLQIDDGWRERERFGWSPLLVWWSPDRMKSSNNNRIKTVHNLEHSASTLQTHGIKLTLKLMKR
jgi:hypothetical protein